MTKKDIKILNSYLNSELTSIWQCYTSFSDKKLKAVNECLDLMKKFNGHSLRFISYNVYQFTCGFIYVDEEGENHLMYISKKQKRDIKLIKNEYSHL